MRNTFKNNTFKKLLAGMALLLLVVSLGLTITGSAKSALWQYFPLFGENSTGAQEPVSPLGNPSEEQGGTVAANIKESLDIQMYVQKSTNTADAVVITSTITNHGAAIDNLRIDGTFPAKALGITQNPMKGNMLYFNSGVPTGSLESATAFRLIDISINQGEMLTFITEISAQGIEEGELSLVVSLVEQSEIKETLSHVSGVFSVVYQAEFDGAPNGFSQWGLLDSSTTRGSIAATTRIPMALENTVFDGWLTPSGGKVGPGETIAITSANKRLVLTPTWRGVSHSVTLDPKNGETPQVYNILKGERIPKPQEPMQIGYTFAGWYFIKENIEHEWDFAVDQIENDLLLYGKWNPKTFNITFKSDEGNITPVTLRVLYGERITPPVFHRPGYLLEGWKDKDGHTLSPILNKAEDITYIAQWNVNPNEQFTVTYLPEGGSVAPKIATYTVGQKLVTPTAQREFYKLKGWQIVDTNTFWDFENDTMPAKNLRLKAIWDFKNDSVIKVTFNSGEGAATPDPQNIAFGKKIVEPTPPRKVDYTFTGWKRQGEKELWNFDTVLQEKDFVAPFVLEATWLENIKREVTVEFYPEGGSPTPADQKLMPGSLIYRPVSPTRRDAIFEGWFTEPTRNSKKWDFRYDTVPAEQSTFRLYAVWWAKPDDSDRRPGTSRVDTSPNVIPGRSRGTSSTVSLSPERPVEVLPDQLNPQEPGTNSTVVGRPKPTLPAGPINPETGGITVGKPKSAVEKAMEKKDEVSKDITTQKPLNQPKKEKENSNVDKTKEVIRRQIEEATVSDLGMYFGAFLMVMAAVLLLIIGIVRKTKKS